jgi:chromosome segregation ATPase
MGDKYIQNVHTNGVKAHSADKKLSYTFRPQTVDHFSGRQTDTGYVRLTEDEYNLLLKESAVFKHFIDLKKLIVHDELPADAQTPHEALVSARKDVSKLNVELDKLKAERDALQMRLDEADKKYGELLAADNGDQLIKAEAALKEAQAKVQTFTDENASTKKAFEALRADYAKLKEEHERLVKARK